MEITFGLKKLILPAEIRHAAGIWGYFLHTSANG
jgi:hypothetical protein